MLFCAYLENKSFKNNTFKDYKSIITSIGILGTFAGIFIALWSFNANDISSSVPALLEGLKFAFITSIAGIFISIVLSITQNLKGGIPSDHIPNDPSDKLINFLDNSHKKERIFLKALHDEQQKSLLSIYEEQKKSNQNTLQINQSIDQLEKNINTHFDTANSLFKQTLDTLSKGATEEIIKALEGVIADFNNNLTEQFGDNFKQLNESVKNMIIWQENYKVAIQQIEGNLNIALNNIEQSSNAMEKFANNFEKISETNEDLKKIIQVNQHQIENIETHLNTLKSIGEEAGLITSSIGDFSKTIQGSLSNQSEGLKKLNDSLVRELDSSLGNLNKALTSLTDKFIKDYQQFLELIKNLRPPK